MMKKTIYIALAFALVSVGADAQKKQIKKAQNNFNDYSFADAIDSYQTLTGKGYSDVQAYQNLGNANYYNANYKEASEWFGKLMATKSEDIDPEDIYRYAQSLKSVGDYKTSDQWMAKFEQAKKSDSRAKKWSGNVDYRDQISKNAGKYVIRNASFNSSNSDFAPAYFGDLLVFATARDTSITSRNVHAWNRKPFLSLYEANDAGDGSYSGAKKIAGVLNKKTHESSAAFTADGSTVYFTRNHSKKGRFARDKEGLSRLQLFKADLKEGEWTNVTALPFNSADYSTAHPALSVDEKYLYFSSDMPGTLGQSDIFVVEILEDGSFGTPKNLGNTINTEGRDNFPFVSAANILYFASDGHPGLGGLDIFAIELNQNGQGDVVNLGETLNSKNDDFSLIVNAQGVSGFFASNREGGLGSDDIYSFKLSEPLSFNCTNKISGLVTDADSKQALANVKVAVKDAAGKIISTLVTNNNGNFTGEEDCAEGEFEFTATKQGYDESTLTFAKHSNKDMVEINLILKKVIIGLADGTDLLTHLGIEPIYFNFDKWDIRKDAQESIKKVITYLDTHPQVKVNIRSHTDLRGNAAYNQQLSLKRAEATKDFLVANGISKGRLIYEGLGESEPNNPCKEDTPCSKTQHQQNRRSEFIVVE